MRTNIIRAKVLPFLVVTYEYKNWANKCDRKGITFEIMNYGSEDSAMDCNHQLINCRPKKG